jgi:2-dehydropantoate 2-reductase
MRYNVKERNQSLEAAVKILVYGAGALGSQYAARLNTAGHDVTLLARGDRLAELREHGIALENVTTGELSYTQVALAEHLRPDDEYNLALVILRRSQVSAALPELAANRHIPCILFLGNNVSGPDEYIQAVGRDRAMFGFAGIGGQRIGGVVRFTAGEKGPQGRTYLGELDGAQSARLSRIVAALQDTPFPAEVSNDIDAWLKTHAALVLPLAGAIYLADGDVYRLAQTRDALVVALRAIRDAFAGLRRSGIPLTPPEMQAINFIPEPLLVAGAARLIGSPLGEVNMAGHANVARDEMQYLAYDLQNLLAASGSMTPALELALNAIEPEEAPLPAGSQRLKLDWRGVWIASAAIAAAAGALVYGLGRRRK